MGEVFFYNYSTCKISNDGKYLLPDSIFLLPILQSKVDLFAEYFDHWDNYTSTTAHSINIDVGYSKISAKFSDEYSTVKSQQVNGNSKTTRVQIRNRLYNIKQQPDSQLHPTFKNRLLEIARNVLNGNKAMASYLAELLVRDYGTHYVTSVEAGAVLMQTDHILSSFAQSASQSANRISASASADFLVKVSISVAYQIEDNQKNAYSSARTSSQITSIGGPLYKTGMTLNDWEAGVPNALVAIDRSGDELYLCINPTTLPDLPPITAMEVANVVYNAITRYYKMNTRYGCAAYPTSANFDFHANVDDGSCKARLTNFAFGGVFQTCSVDPNYNRENLCPSYSQTNPLTGGYTCPTGYMPVNLHSGTVNSIGHGNVCNKICHHCGWFSTCCSCKTVQVMYMSLATYQTYWCAAIGNVPQNSGFLFGGVFSLYGANPVTSSMSCPLYFIPLRMAGVANVTVCVSADYELGYPYSLPFGGFDSCVVGNPLATSAPNRTHRDNWPKRCPQGYSQHLVALDEDCEINYCVRSGVLSQKALNPIKLPPYRRTPPPAAQNATEAYVHSANGEIWLKGEDNRWENHKYGPSNGMSVIAALNSGVNYTEYSIENPSTHPPDTANSTGQSPNATAFPITGGTQNQTAAPNEVIGKNEQDGNNMANETEALAWVSFAVAGVTICALLIVIVIAAKMAYKKCRPLPKPTNYIQMSS